MRCLSDDEATWLALCTPPAVERLLDVNDDSDVVTDDERVICVRLAALGLVHLKEFTAPIDEENEVFCDYWIATPLGRIALACHAAVKAVF